MSSKKYFITTLGCPKNQADTREMERSLLEAGFEKSATPNEADYYLINSCGFIKSAKEETIQTVLDAASIKKENEEQKLILVGCFVERYSSEVKKDLTEVDFSFGTGLYHKAAELILKRFPEIKLSPVSVPSALKDLEYSSGKVYAPLKVSEGCNRGCHFCAIPSFRGPFRKIDRVSIIEEAKRLAAVGVRELDIVSQDTNHYDELISVIEDLENLDGISWVRLLYLYPDAKTEKILDQLASHRFSKLVPYFESPIQHASTAVLKSMGRAGNKNQYLDLFAKARSLFDNLEVRTSLLLGFPGETIEDVEETIDFLEQAKVEKLALFGYSPEEGTKGFSMNGKIKDREIQNRVNDVRKAHLAVLKDIHKNRVGQIYDCMVDEIHAEGCIARRAQDAPEVDEVVEIPRTDLKVGEIYKVKITGFFEYDMTGEIV